MHEVTIAGEPRTIGEFSAAKAFKAMELVADVEDTYRELVDRWGEFKRDYEGKHYTEMDRAEARRYFAAAPLSEVVPVLVDGEVVREDGEVVVTRQPILDAAGKPVLGPDPLGHLTEADWAGSGQKLRVPESPSKPERIADLVPLGFRLAKTHVLRLLALVLVPNADLEQWDEAGNVDLDAKLDEQGKKLLHAAKLDEYVRLAIAAVDVLQEQLIDPFEDLLKAADRFTKARAAKAEEEREPVAAPMTMEPSDDGSTSSPGDTPGIPSPSSTEPAGVSSSSSGAE